WEGCNRSWLAACAHAPGQAGDASAGSVHGGVVSWSSGSRHGTHVPNRGELRLGSLADSTYGIAREFVHKHDGGDGSAQDASILEEEWTAWTGAITPPVVTSTRSFSSPSGTPARPCSRSKRQSRSAPGARSPRRACNGRSTAVRTPAFGVASVRTSGGHSSGVASG